MAYINKVVLVTGGSSGIGAATAILFSKHGANVVIVGRNEKKLNNVAEKCGAANKVLRIKADITNDDETKTMMDYIISTFGKLDVLVNNAGQIRFASVLEGDTLQIYDSVLNINLRAHVQVTTLAAPYLIKTKGNIINVSSAVAAVTPKDPKNMFYYLSKAALSKFSQYLAAEMAPHGVRVNAISPGLIDTDLLKNAGLDIKFADTDFITPLNGNLEEENIAANILYLTSDTARHVTGANLFVDGGFAFAN